MSLRDAVPSQDAVSRRDARRSRTAVRPRAALSRLVAVRSRAAGTRRAAIGRRGWRVAVAGVAAAALGAGLLTATPAQAGWADPMDHVDVFIGTQDNHAADTTESAYGDTTPGATTPFGMVNFNPNTYNSAGGSHTNQGGYEYDADQIRGLSLNRVSGTGCAGRNGAEDFPIYPYAGALSGGLLPTSPGADVKSYYTPFSHGNESASPGAYQVTLDNGIDAQLTATTRTADGRFRFPSDAKSGTLVFDAAGSINGTEGTTVSVVDDHTLQGTTTVQATCKQGITYTAHFFATFSQPFASSGTWQGGTVSHRRTAQTSDAHGAGAFVSFAPGSTVDVRIGLSYVSLAGAKRNERAEARRAFPALRAQARNAWRHALGRVRVRPSSRDASAQLETFYTALYHTMQEPSIVDDVDGRYAGYDGATHRVRRGHHEYGTYSGWDIYRDEVQLIALLFPDRASDMNQSITDLATQVGWYNWPMLSAGQNKMAGDSLDIALASMDAFGATDYDRRAAQRSMVESQTLTADGVSRANHRAGFQQYATLGFLPDNADAAWPTSTTLEYALDDFAIAQMSARLGDEKAANAFMVRAQSWQHVFDPETNAITPRSKNGFDSDYDLSTAGSQFSEASGRQYGYLVPQNVAGLVAKKGGRQAVEKELDTFFSNLEPGSDNANPGHDSPYAYLSNEIDSQDPELYDWIGRPDRTAEVNQDIRNALWTNNEPDGLYGNDDLGALSAWYVWSSIGLFPAIYGRAELVVSGPAFRSVRIERSGPAHRTYTIDAPRQSTAAKYVTGMTVDGHDRSATWLPPAFARDGGHVRFTMSTAPNDWGTAPGDAPPSFGAGSNARNNVSASPAGHGVLGGFDASHNSYPAEQLPAPGSTVRLPGSAVGYRWPDAAAGSPDNWIPHGQTIAMHGVRAARLSFLGAATNGPATGSAVVNYADGTHQTVQVALDDWTTPTLPSGTDTAVVTTTHRNNANGSADDTTAYVWGTAPVDLAGKAVESVTLPASTDRGIMHVFALGTAP